jgi:hypothetical protein
MNKMAKIKNLMHNDSLQLFNETLYADVLTINEVVSKKKAVKIDDVKHYGYFLEKGKKMYFIDYLPDQDKSVLDVLPIIVTDKVEYDYNKEVFWFIKSYGSVKIPVAKKMEMRVVIDTLAGFEHTNPIHFKLSKIVNVAAYCSRLNFRIISERGFGKDSVINNIRDLNGSVANIYGATFAKLEYSLKHKYLVFNEMGNLKSDDKYNMQQFLLATGAFFNKYVKRSRATEDTQEEYDISKTSLGIIYNPPMYYVERGQEFFDIMFTKAVSNRFIPFYFTGTLSESFDAEYDVKSVVNTNMQIYKDLVSSILYFKENQPVNKYEIPDDIVFGNDLKRFERTFLKVCDFISEYATDEKEYYTLVYELWNSYRKYDDILAEAMLHIKGD